jgi:AraC-like DNA-binding protein
MLAWTGERDLSIVLGSPASERPSTEADLDLLCAQVLWHFRGRKLSEPLIGISRQVFSLEGLRAGLCEALEALSCRGPEEGARVMHHADVVAGRSDAGAYDEVEAELLKLVSMGDEGACASLLEAWFGALRQQEAPLGWIQAMSMNLIVSAMRAASRVSGETGMSPRECADAWERMGDVAEAKFLEEEVVGRCRRLARGVAVSMKDRASAIVSRAKRSVELRFRENLTLGELAQAECITPYYLGNLFKRHSGISFADYLNLVRLEKARALLLAGNRMTYEVAAEAGYGNVSYFCSQFKNRYGVSPKQFKA